VVTRFTFECTDIVGLNLSVKPTVFLNAEKMRVKIGFPSEDEFSTVYETGAIGYIDKPYICRIIFDAYV